MRWNEGKGRCPTIPEREKTRTKTRELMELTVSETDSRQMEGQVFPRHGLQHRVRERCEMKNQELPDKFHSIELISEANSCQRSLHNYS